VRDGVGAQRLLVVHHDDHMARHLDADALGKGAGPVGGIHVAADRGDRSDLRQPLDDPRTPDIARVQDVLDPASRSSASGRSRPWVSEITPTRIGQPQRASASAAVPPSTSVSRICRARAGSSKSGLWAEPSIR